MKREKARPPSLFGTTYGASSDSKRSTTSSEQQDAPLAVSLKEEKLNNGSKVWVLTVGEYSVSSIGCSTLTQELLINSDSSEAPAIAPTGSPENQSKKTDTPKQEQVAGFLLEMPSTPPLRTTNMEEPVSPMVYGNLNRFEAIASPSIPQQPEDESEQRTSIGRPVAYVPLQYEDLQIPERPIDAGATGSVYHATHKSIPSKSFAVKRIDVSVLLEALRSGHDTVQKHRQATLTLYRELHMLHNAPKYRSTHVVKTYNAFFSITNSSVDIVMEFMDFGSLERLGFIVGGANRAPLPERVLAVVAEQVLIGLRDIHAHGYVHRDIKPRNILINKFGNVKLSDFGLTEKISTLQKAAGQFIKAPLEETDLEMCSGTNKYMSPERQRGEEHGPSSDVWALGMTLAECACGRYPVDLSGTKDIFEAVERLSEVHFPPTVEPKLSSEFKEFIALTMKRDPPKRPPANDLLHHSLLSRWKGQFDFADYLNRSYRTKELQMRNAKEQARATEERHLEAVQSFESGKFEMDRRHSKGSSSTKKRNRKAGHRVDHEDYEDDDSH